MKAIKKIIIISTKIRGGGAERVVSVLSSALAELGYQVDLILYERYEDEYPISNSVNIHMLPIQGKHQNKAIYLINKFIALRQIIRRINPDVLIPFLPYQVEHTFFASRGLGIPMVVTVRNNPLYDTPNDKMRRRRDWIADKVEGVFLQTPTQLDYFSEEVKKKCFVVPNPVDESIMKSSYCLGKSIRRLVTVGRLSPQKNQELLIGAVYSIRKQGVDVLLDIYGAGDLEGRLKTLICELELEEAVKVCGRTNNIASTLSEYDMFVMTSDYEGMPNALMEAMGVGLPCISTDCPTGPNELIGKDERGLLIPVGDEEALKSAINYAINNVEIMKEKAEKAKKYIQERYAPKAIGKTLISELEKIL